MEKKPKETRCLCCWFTPCSVRGRIVVDKLPDRSDDDVSLRDLPARGETLVEGIAQGDGDLGLDGNDELVRVR